ncbi:ribonucleoside-diphosphate reductase subunit alpha [Sphaerochaeta coccoides]|uniref:Ribonucleoside-diphosphate reductase n=1 Tax=Parasphaerochaeta coccoides (strain ATCC BAA-1237 / DSM 17374 / SPN1) TaxID=760011 RepID=F4GLD2_PARC1|nr:ribonucleoside-diphosphate reductase, alpha subunit [Parasphaerochaeta coccoides DSM 17374]
MPAMETIIKRTGKPETYQEHKITAAMKAAFASRSHTADDTILSRLTGEVHDELTRLHASGTMVDVELIQDTVEKILMKHEYFDVAKSYILYRSVRTKKRDDRKKILNLLPVPELEPVLISIQRDYADAPYQLDLLYGKFSAFSKPGMETDESLGMLVRAAVEMTTQDAPDWEFIAARLRYLQFSLTLKKQESRYGFSDLFGKIRFLTTEGLYGAYILEKYTHEEIDRAAAFIDEKRNDFLTYSALDLLLQRYVIRSHEGELLETPQELFLGIALHLAMDEKKDRLDWVRRFYDMISTLKVTMATPTLSNARKPYHQLSSCFIDTVPDTLDGIYRSVTNFSQVSKFGGGMGLYFGKVRAVGSAIRDFKGVAGGVIRWIKLANDTAVAVDQLGMRQGAVAVYLDAWHKDLPEFLQLRTNNGDDRMKAHDVFPGVCYPDLFWRMVENDIEGTWNLMCPYEIYKVKGYHLEDSYGDEWEKRYHECLNDPAVPKRPIKIKELVRMIIKSGVETGTPFAFFRDAVNKANPNAHKGMIYCSNLCTEIAQNMAPITQESVEVTTEGAGGDIVVVEKTKPGEFVVCNLASLVLGNINVDDPVEVEGIVTATVRALDNVIDLNMYPVPYAEITNKRYRAIGLGTSGYHHMLAKKGVAWESEAHLGIADRVFEAINYWAVKASSDIAAEKGSYAYFEGSDWQTGAYFDKRNYTGDRWAALRSTVAKQGMRNAYLIAIAPTSSTSILAGTTAGLDPVLRRFFLEEKKKNILPRVAPELSPKTYWLYKNAHLIDQIWTVRAAGVRQRHVDQAQSLNLYITTDMSFRQIMNLYVEAWKNGVKTIYYLRSKALEVDECDSCAS